MGVFLDVFHHALFVHTWGVESVVNLFNLRHRAKMEIEKVYRCLSYLWEDVTYYSFYGDW